MRKAKLIYDTEHPAIEACASNEHLDEADYLRVLAFYNQIVQSELSEIERAIHLLRVDKEMTFAEIAAEVGMSTNNASLIAKKADKKVRKALNKKLEI